MCYPKVTELPEGEWFCGYCRARSKFIAKVEDVKQEIAEKKSNTIDAVPSGATEDSAPSTSNASQTAPSDEKTVTTSKHIPNIITERVDGDGKFNKKTKKRSPKGASATKSLAPISVKDRAATFSWSSGWACPFDFQPGNVLKISVTMNRSRDISSSAAYLVPRKSVKLRASCRAALNGTSTL